MDIVWLTLVVKIQSIATAYFLKACFRGRDGRADRNTKFPVKASQDLNCRPLL